jgi:hypothetical protein
MMRRTVWFVLGSFLVVACTKLPESSLPTSIEPLGLPLPPDPGPSDDAPGLPPSNDPDPAPPADPTPAPTPQPTPPPPDNGSCSLQPMPAGSPCSEETPSFEREVATAQAVVARDRPDLVIGDTVVDQDAYVREVARVLRVQFGLCAEQGGPPDEVAVKRTNNWNDQYDIVIGGSFQTWTNYTVTCRPARF